MLGPLGLLFALIAVRPDGAELRSGCDPSSEVVARLPAGARVDLRYSVNDGSDCFRVGATLEGKRVEGYLDGARLSGLHDFEAGLRQAPDGSAVRFLTPSPDRPAARAPPLALPTFNRKPSLSLAEEGSLQKLHGMRVVLLFDPQAVRPELAQSLVSFLDTEFIRVSSQLVCPAGDRIEAILQSRQAYFKATDAAEWSAGQYDGRIRVPMPESSQAIPDLHRVLSHEIVHACLSNISAHWPGWLQEGLAQKLSGDRLAPDALARLDRLIAARAVPRLENIGQSWSRMSAQYARVAYDLALAAVDLLYEADASNSVRTLLANPGRLQAVTATLDRRLGLSP